MADNLSILITSKLNLQKSEQDIQKQIKELEKKISALNIKSRLDLSESSIKKFQQQINKLAKSINVKLNVKVDNKNIENVSKTINSTKKQIDKNTNSNSLRLFDIEKLNEQGRKYFNTTTNIVSRVKKEFSTMGDVNVNVFKNSKEQITGFVAEIKKADGIVEKFNFNLAKLKNSNNKTTRGFIFDSGGLSDKNAGNTLQSTLNKLNEFQIKLSKLQYNSLQSSKGLKDDIHIKTITQEYNSLFSQLTQIKNTQSNISQEQQRSIKKQISNLDLLIKKYKELEHESKPKSIGKSNVLDVDNYVQKMNNQIARLKVGKENVFAKSSVNGELSKLETMLTSLSTTGTGSLKQIGLQFDNLKTKVAQTSNEFKNVNKDGYSFAEMMGLATKKVAIWSLSTGILYSGIHNLQDGVKYIIDLDNAMNEVMIVSGKTKEQVDALALSYNHLAKEMHVTTSELATTSADLYRQGLNDSQVEDRLESIVKYAKISSISLDNANKIITATANATGEDTQKIIDIFAQLGDTTASGADEIGEALQRVASASENSNLSLEKTSSWLSTISSVSRESASTIGRSLNSIISRYESIKAHGFNSEDATRINDVTKALSAVGINPIVNGQLRDLSEVMDEIGGKWVTLSKNEKAYIATTMAGTYQRNRFITLMNNYDDSLNNYETALNSAGTAEQKFAIYSESAQAHIDTFKSSIDGMWQNTLNSNELKLLIDLGTGIVNLTDKFGLLNTTILALTLTALKFNTAFKTFYMNEVVGGLTTLINRIIGVNSALEITAVTATGLRGILLTMLPVAVLTGVLLLGKYLAENAKKANELSDALAVTVMSYKDLKTEIDATNDSARKNISEVNSQAKTAENYANKLKELSAKTNLNSYEQEQMRLAVKGLNEIIPNLNLSIDATTGKLNMQYGEIMKNVDAFKKLGLAQAYQAVVGEKQKQLASTQLSYDKDVTDVKKIDISSYNPINQYKVNKLHDSMSKKMNLIDELNSDIDSGIKKVDEYSQGLDSLLSSTPASTGGGTYSGSGTSSKDSKSTPSEIEWIDPTEAIINTINKQVILDKIQNDYLEKQIKIAENAKDYAKQIELQNQLLNNQNRTVSDLKLANDQIHAQADLVRSKTKYNTESWFNADNSDTTSYIALLNSFEGKSDEASKKVVEKIKTIHDKIKTLKDGWISNKDAIDNMNLSIQTTSNTINDLKIKALEAQKDALQKIIDLTVELIKHEKEEEKQAIQNKIDAYKDYINLQKESLELLEKEKSYNETVDEKTDAIAKLRKQADTLNLDDSKEAQAQRADILEQIAEKQKDLNKFQHDDAVEKQQSALDKQLKSFENEKEEEIKEIENYLKKTGQLTRDAMRRIDNDGYSLYQDLINYNSLYSDKLESEITSSWESATKALEQYGSTLNAITNMNTAINASKTTSTSTDSSSSKADVKAQMQANSKAWHDADKEERKRLSSQNDNLGASINAYKDYSSGKWYTDYTKKTPLYHNGLEAGFVGGNVPVSLKQNELFALLQEGELVINKEQQERLLDTVNLFKNIVPPISNNFDKLQNSNVGLTVKVEAPVTITGNADSSTIKQLEKFGDSLVDKTITKLNNSYNLRGLTSF